MPRKIGDKSDLLTKEEMDKLIEAASINLYFNTLYKVLRYSGRRIGELYGTIRGKNFTGGVKLKDINFKNKTLKTIILKNKKRNLKIICDKCKMKTIYKNKYCPTCGTLLPKIDDNKLKYSEPEEIIIAIRDDVIEILKTYIKNHIPEFKTDDYIFRDYSLIYIKKKIKEHVKKAKINKKFSIHGFRTYFISNLIRAGLTDSQIIKWTGHSNTSSLKNYNKLIPKDIEDKINKVDL